MRRFLAGVLGLALLAPAWADDQQSDPSDQPKAPTDHADSLQVGHVCKAFAQRPDGDRLIREVREKATDPGAKLDATFCLAEALQEKDDATAADTKEAEKLLEEVVAKGKGVKGLSP